MPEVSSAVLNQKVDNIDRKLSDFIDEMKDHIKYEGEKLADISNWKSMVTGALIIMNVIFVPIFIWVIIRLLEKRI